jgi:hypothetical protein
LYSVIVREVREKEKVPPECLTVLVPIKPGEVDALRAVLRPIGDDINGTHLPPGGRPHVAFPNSRAIHFARFAILTDPDRGPGRKRLLYASVYDGSLEAHAAELIAVSSDFDAIWGKLEGYTGRGAFTAFLEAHAHQPAAYYIAFRDETVDSIRAGVAAREAMDAARDEGQVQVPPSAPGSLRAWPHGSAASLGLRPFSSMWSSRSRATVSSTCTAARCGFSRR